MTKTDDIKPTLTDSQVLDFCKKGYLTLPAVVPDKINRRVVEYVNETVQVRPELQAPRRSKEIEFHLPLLDEQWFIDHVLLNPAVAGAVRCLLGRNFTMPIIISDHRAETPMPKSGGWHRDGNYVHDKKLKYLEVLYHPEDVNMLMGPTEILPGSHHLASGPVGHYGSIKGSVPFAPPEAPAGSILIMSYNLWHRRTASSAKGYRHLLRYNYWRTTAPVRDWLTEPSLDLRTANYEFFDRPTTRPPTRDCNDAAEMFFWMCGMHDQFAVMGGQCWPSPHRGLDGAVQGFPGDITDEREWPEASSTKLDRGR